METLSKCCQAIILYLDCEDCRKNNSECIYVCSECGKESIDD